MTYFRLALKIQSVLLLVAIVCLHTSTGYAQVSPQNESYEIKSMSGEINIWTGTAKLRWYNYYTSTLDGLEENSNTEIDVEFRNIRMLSSRFGWGIEGVTQVYMSGAFGNIGLGNLGIGPLARGYLWQDDHWQLYLQGGLLGGFDLALSDALGANRGKGIMYRLGLRTGLTYRISNNFGIYWEIGPDWEADSSLEVDASALQLDIGIQLFRF